jgi:hypothetical protein
VRAAAATRTTAKRATRRPSARKSAPAAKPAARRRGRVTLGGASVAS